LQPFRRGYTTQKFKSQNTIWQERLPESEVFKVKHRATKKNFQRSIKREIKDIQLAKSRTARRKGAPAKRKQTSAAKPTQAPPAAKKSTSLSQLLTPKNLQESLKTVVNLRSTVKNWLQYLNQADQMLDTLFITSSSLKESGVLEKLVKHKGKNLTTEDFTNILIAFMNSPLGGHLLKGAGGGQSQDDQAQTQAQAQGQAQSQPQPQAQAQAMGQAQAHTQTQPYGMGQAEAQNLPQQPPPPPQQPRMPYM
jgi:hypothetical protein